MKKEASFLTNLFYNTSMRTLIILLIILFTYTASAWAETKTTRIYDKKGTFTSKVVENGSNFVIYDRTGKRIGYGRSNENGAVIYDTKGNRIAKVRK